MSEFTKGTWEAGIDTSSMLPYVWTKLKNIPAKIAVMHRCPYIKDKEQLANARLIAAAPEMYELLKAVCRIEKLEYYKHYVVSNGAIGLMLIGALQKKKPLRLGTGE